jgi:hypothetical protein
VTYCLRPGKASLGRGAHLGRLQQTNYKLYVINQNKKIRECAKLKNNVKQKNKNLKVIFLMWMSSDD